MLTTHLTCKNTNTQEKKKQTNKNCSSPRGKGPMSPHMTHLFPAPPFYSNTQEEKNIRIAHLSELSGLSELSWYFPDQSWIKELHL